MTNSDNDRATDSSSSPDGSTDATDEQKTDTAELPDGTGSTSADSSSVDEGESDYASGSDPE